MPKNWYKYVRVPKVSYPKWLRKEYNTIIGGSDVIPNVQALMDSTF